MDTFGTPIGRFAVVSDEAGRLLAAGFTDGHERMEARLAGNASSPSLRRSKDPFGLRSAIEAYFDGDLHAIDGLPVASAGTTFQMAVWKSLRRIPCGQTRSYADIARSIRNPKAVRAVGMANHHNPVGLVVPCHRVVGADGSLGGYGGGIDRKRWLLRHEGAAGVWETAEARRP